MNFADIINKIINILQSIGVNDVIDICIIWAVVYYVLKLVNKTRAYQLLKFLAIILFVWGVSSILNLKATLILLQSLSQIGFIALIVIFQPELRRVLEQVSNMDFLKSSFLIRKTADERIEKINCGNMRRCGANEQFPHRGVNRIGKIFQFGNRQALRHRCKCGHNTGAYRHYFLRGLPFTRRRHDYTSQQNYPCGLRFAPFRQFGNKP